MAVTNITNITQISNYNEFKSTVVRHGYSTSNLYDILFELPGSAGIFSEFLETFKGASTDGEITVPEALQLMRLFTTECTMPGVTMADSEYRVTNTPQLKYAYGAVFNEFNVTFLMDSNSTIRKIFDKWTNIIYPYSRFRGNTSNTGPLRTSYKDSYISDITVIKYERGPSSSRNRSRAARIPGKRIVFDTESNANSYFRENVPVHAVKMKNAFPKTIDSMNLSSGESTLTQFSVSFEYESLQVSTLPELQLFSFE